MLDQDQGLYEGSHAEGAVLNSILGLLFWDEIYLEKVNKNKLILNRGPHDSIQYDPKVLLIDERGRN